ncbi:type I secretion system permease/ATPase [Thalassovita sp.]|uniref:type I secretion system permease/ATPase n=1 Tax=Thalassovita sp. TaxID=1979401 RepID=UPI002B26A0A6|nr:type I secretion system permease/ATPase [Thalassovita sp.]
MTPRQMETGRQELLAARRESRGLYWAVALFSFFVNLLMLTSPLYMLQVYDRVLGSRSVETLFGLTLLVAFLFFMMGLLDVARTRIMARVGARFQARLDRRVFDAVIRKSALKPDQLTATGLRDLESVQRLISSPALTAFFDIPWTPFFLFGIMIFHPWLGYLAISGGVVLVLITLANQTLTRQPMAQANQSVVASEHFASQLQAEAESVQAMGMREATFHRWEKSRNRALSQYITATDSGGGFSVLSKTFRQFLQSAMLGLGAYLVLHGELSPGAMIAGSILMGRALAPIEMLINQWSVVQRASKGWHNLAELLSMVPPETERTPLPTPQAKLEVQSLTVVPPGEAQATLRMINFMLPPGTALGVIGPSGAGKSSLARAITGLWRPAGGKIRLDGATLDQYDPTVLGQLIGYLPQRVELFDGTIAENIARLSPEPDPEKIVAAAKRADAHSMIVKLPDGYDTRVTASGGRLSGGQIQRIGLARAMYSAPVILVLDEPNSNLDNEGSMALNSAIRTLKSEGKSVIIMAHRPAAIQECDLLLMLENGAVKAFGPKDDVLQEVVKNSQQLKKTAGQGGMQ